MNDVIFFLVFFFFKQKTAYEMSIGDWSSDVCSSDLAGGRPQRAARTLAAAARVDSFDVHPGCPREGAGRLAARVALDKPHSRPLGTAAAMPESSANEACRALPGPLISPPP